MKFSEAPKSLFDKRGRTQELARQALEQIVEQLATYVIDTGLSARDVQRIVRAAIVKDVARRQLESTSRLNIAGISASTGIPRAEVSKTLNVRGAKSARSVTQPPNSTAKVLSAWYSEPQFTDSRGQPADLNLYGRGSTFDKLVKANCPGTPTRALLEELLRINAVEVIDSQKIRAKSSVVVHRGVSEQAIKNFGDRAAELLFTMLQNMRASDKRNPEFVATVVQMALPNEAMPLIRRELASRASEFLGKIQDDLAQEAVAKGRQSSNSLSVTVFSCESLNDKKLVPREQKKRKNYHRSIS